MGILKRVKKKVEIASDFIEEEKKEASKSTKILSKNVLIKKQVVLGTFQERPLSVNHLPLHQEHNKSFEDKSVLTHRGVITDKLILGQSDTEDFFDENAEEEVETPKTKNSVVVELDPYKLTAEEQASDIEQRAYDRGFAAASQKIVLKEQELNNAYQQGFAEALQSSKEQTQVQQESSNAATNTPITNEDLEKAFQEGKVAAQNDSAWIQERLDAAFKQGQDEYKQNSQELKAELETSFEEGVEQGKEDAKRLVAEKVDEIFQAIEKMQEEKNKMLDEAKKPLVDFALSMAERIVQSEIKSNEETLLNLVDEGINKLLESDKVVIRANAENMKFLKDKAEYFEKRLPHIKAVIFQEDNAIDSAGCIFETDLGFVESTLNAKMDYLKEAMHHEDLHE